MLQTKFECPFPRGVGEKTIWRLIDDLEAGGIVRLPNRVQFPVELRAFLESYTLAGVGVKAHMTRCRRTFSGAPSTSAVTFLDFHLVNVPLPGDSKQLTDYAKWATGLGNRMAQSTSLCPTHV